MRRAVMMQAVVGVLVETTVLPGACRRREAALMRQEMMTKMMKGVANRTIPPTLAPTPTATLLPESVGRRTDLSTNVSTKKSHRAVCITMNERQITHTNRLQALTAVEFITAIRAVWSASITMPGR